MKVFIYILIYIYIYKFETSNIIVKNSTNSPQNFTK